MGRTGIEFMFFISSPAAASHLLRRLVPSWTQPAADKRNVNPRNGENTSGAPVPKKDPLHLWLFFLFFSFFFPNAFFVFRRCPRPASDAICHCRRRCARFDPARRPVLPSPPLSNGLQSLSRRFPPVRACFFRNFWISRLILLGFTGFYLVPLCLTWLY